MVLFVSPGFSFVFTFIAVVLIFFICLLVAVGFRVCSFEVVLGVFFVPDFDTTDFADFGFDFGSFRFATDVGSAGFLVLFFVPSALFNF